MTAPQPPESGQQQPALTLRGFHQIMFYLSGWEAGWPDAKIEALERHYWPLSWYKAKGIEMGEQEVMLRDLAARYARDFEVSELADELWEVMQASPQRHGYGRDGPWTRGHAVSIAARAKRFTDREDAAQARRDAAFMACLHASGFFRWHEGAMASGQPAREPGTRQAARRVPGRRAS